MTDHGLTTPTVVVGADLVAGAWDDAPRIEQALRDHVAPLRSGELGMQFTLDGLPFQQVAAGRNMVYRVTARNAWFAKVLRRPGELVIARERHGARLTAQALASHPGYGGARVVCVSDDPSYVLASAIPGTPLNKLTTTGVWIPSRAAVIDAAFARVGALLATLHRDAVVTPDVPPASTFPFAHLRSLLDAERSRDEIGLAGWCAAHARADDGPHFIHGNFRLDNIIHDGPRIGFLDFENSGTGSRYQDLSRPLAELALGWTLLVYPRETARRWMRSIIAAYAAHQPVDAGELWDVVGARMGRYYLESQAKPFWRLQVRGVPVLRHRLRRLLDAVVECRLPAFLGVA